MKKHLFIAPWNLEKIEQKLLAMEHEGYHLTSVQFPHGFIFEEGKPRDIQYIFLYSELKEYGLLHWRSVFLSNEFHGDELQNKSLLFYRIIRMKNTSDNLMIKFFNERRIYIYRIHKNRFFASLFASGFVTALLACNYYNTSKLPFLFVIILLLFIVIAGYNLYGMISVKKQGHMQI